MPILYLGVVYWLQPPTSLGFPEAHPWLKRLLYDDYDMTAMALRGLNAHQGRLAGRVDDPFREYFLDSSGNRWEKFDRQLDNPPSLKDRYFLEYPQAALGLFRLGWMLQVEPRAGISPAILDTGHNLIVEHSPRNEVEQSLWYQFRRVIQTYEAFMIVCLLGLMALFRLGYEPASRMTGPLALCLLPGMLYFTLNRFDIVPALLTGLSLFFLGRRQMVVSAAFLGAATMVKVYPVLLAPLVVSYLLPNRRQALNWILSFAGTVGLFLGMALLQSDWLATMGPYKFQLSRELESGTFYGHIFPLVMGSAKPGWSLFRLGCVGVTVAVMAWSRPAGLPGLLRRSAVVLVVFVALQVFYSPQWILWFSPLLIPLAREQRAVGSLALGLDLVTYLSFPVVYDGVGLLETQADLHRWLAGALVCGRFALLTTLVAVLVCKEFRTKAG